MPREASQSVVTAEIEINDADAARLKSSFITVVSKWLISAGAKEFIVCIIACSSITMNSFIILKQSIKNGITEIIRKNDACAAYILTLSPARQSINRIISRIAFLNFFIRSTIAFHQVIKSPSITKYITKPFFSLLIIIKYLRKF